jgi:hypothetical protein
MNKKIEEYQEYFLLLILVLLPFEFACNRHPAEKVEDILNAVVVLDNSLPPKTKLDFLFVVDNSDSMCQEQERLSKNFTLFSNFIFDELKGTADYRIAVTSTDIGSAKDPADRQNKGAFLYAPAPSNIPVCRINDQPEYPNTEDCPATGPNGNVINSEEIDAKSLAQLIEELGELSNDCAGDQVCQEKFYRKAYLEKLFRCSATLGTKGYYFEKGLESMRIALSCDGPNASLFGSCCQTDANGKLFYNPVCEPTAEDQTNGLPAFLRPDAKLVIVIISDENDCSTPGDNPALTGRLICAPEGTTDLDSNGLPDLYEMSYRGAAADFYERDCGSYEIVACKENRCDVTYNQTMECDWNRSSLTDVSEYKEFLQKLKAKPDVQIILAPVVGFRGYTEKGNVMVYNQADEYADPLCVPNADPRIDNPLHQTETCCPNGQCAKISINQSCEIPEKDISAGAGTRYLELASLLGINGLGCDAYEEPQFEMESLSYQRKGFCLPILPNCVANGTDCSAEIAVVLKCKNPNDCTLSNSQEMMLSAQDWQLNASYGNCPARIELLNQSLPNDLFAEIQYVDQNATPQTYQSKSCVNICQDNFVEPLKIIKNRVAQLLSTYCLDRLPSCRINENNMERACTDEEAMNVDHYASNMIVSRQCLSDRCDVQEPRRNLTYQTDWQLKLSMGESCVATVELLDIPPAASELSIEFISNTNTPEEE